MTHRFPLCFALAVLSLSGVRYLALADPPVPIYKDNHAPLEARVDDLFRRLTLDERHSLLAGTYFTTQPIDRLDVPAMAMADGGLGVRGGMISTQGPATLFPAGIILGASWDPELARRIGAAIGEEASNKGDGVQVVLGPDLNIHRSPLNGRTSESFSEDPYLTGRITAGIVQGIQSQGVAACIKHFACNNEEQDRGFVDVVVSQRALREIYLPGFEAGVKEGHAWVVMTAYNKVNGHYCSENKYLLRNVLKNGWGFDGMVVSDWGGVHTTRGPVVAGNDLEMPGPGLLSPDEIRLALNAGWITESEVDDADKRILRTIIRTGRLDPTRQPDYTAVGSAAHRQLALEGAEAGMVLLKNSGSALPLDSQAIKSIAVIGPCAQRWQMGDGGSAYVEPTAASQPLDAIKRRVGPGVRVDYVPGIDLYGIGGEPVPTSALSLPDGSEEGLRAQYFAGDKPEGTPLLTRTDPNIQFDWDDASPDPMVPRDRFCVRWTGKLTAPETGEYQLSMTADDGCRLVVDGKTLIDNWNPTPGFTLTSTIDLVAGHSYDIRIDYLQIGGRSFCYLNWALPGTPNSFTDAINAARSDDAAIVLVGTGGEGEGGDRGTLLLPGDEANLISAVAAANKRIIVVLNNGGPVTMEPWLDQVPAVLDAWFPGEAGGDALASILFGDVNPSGKLPDTIGKRREDYPDFGHFPGTNGVVNYAEGIYVGYRHFDKANIAPQFPFGFGLSYTTFQYGDLRLSSPTLSPSGSITASVDITNTGSRAGAEVAELYVHDPRPLIDKPVRELRSFEKVMLDPGQTKTVRFTVAARALSYCDVAGCQWKADAGTYDIDVGASSRDIRAQRQLQLTSTFTQAIPDMAANVLPDGSRDMAYMRPVQASSSQAADTGPSYAVDGDETTRWSSAFSDPQWIAVDLGAPKKVSSVMLSWEAAYASAYTIQLSNDNHKWVDVYNTKSGRGGIAHIAFRPTEARWVRINCHRRATKYGYSIYSFEVFAPVSSPRRFKG